MDGARDYAEASEFQRRDAAEVVEEFAGEIAAMSGRCIDIGCGPGTVTREVFLPRLPLDTSVVGSDISESMIEFASCKYEKEKRLSFVVLDIETDKIPENQINAYENAVSFYCLHWCLSPRKACENIFDLLRPGGCALVLFLARYDALNTYLVLQEKAKYKPYMKNAEKFIPNFQTSNCPREQFNNILQDVGFEVLHCSVREKTFIYENVEVLKKHTWAVNPFISLMPDGMAEPFVNELVETSLKMIDFRVPKGKSRDECKVLHKYDVMVAYFRKPVS